MMLFPIHSRPYILVPKAILLVLMLNFWISSIATAYHCSNKVSSYRSPSSSPLTPTCRLGHPLLVLTRTNTVTSLTKSSGNDLAPTRPNPSVLLAAQSPLVQKLGVLGICTILGGGTLASIHLLTLLEEVMPYGWYDFWRDATWPIGFGGIYLAAGIAHFTSKQAFVNIVPPYGTWGLWKVPAPGAQTLGLTYGEYHTYWTGIAEIGGGILLLGSLLTDNIPVEVPSFLLFLLTIAVTPANIYMFTHDAEMGGGIPPIPYPWGHVGRGVMQMVILAMLWKLSFP